MFHSKAFEGPLEISEIHSSEKHKKYMVGLHLIYQKTALYKYPNVVLTIVIRQI